MKAYLLTTGVVFVLIVLGHVARVFADGPHLLSEPFFIVTTLLAIGLAVWAWLLFRQLSLPPKKV